MTHKHKQPPHNEIEPKEKIEEISVEKTEVETLKEQLAEQKNLYLRALADFDNFKKRSALDKEQFVLFATEKIVTDLLPIIDGFGRAIDSATKGNSPDELIKGLAMIKRQIEDTLKKHGVTEIEAKQKAYDPHFHEAILQKEDAGPEGINIEELQKGYTLNGRVIRPSMVIVSKKKEDL
ncbi:MAG: nucleotide exchange factor GrpE [Candidatus Margulisiibacteriota bacterium]